MARFTLYGYDTDGYDMSYEFFVKAYTAAKNKKSRNVTSAVLSDEYFNSQVKELEKKYPEHLRRYKDEYAVVDKTLK